jgi:hypothetical protein
MKRLTQESFIEKCEKVHGKNYSYVAANYVNNRIKIKIICLVHGEFYQKPNNHLLGQGCPECAEKKPLDTQSFIIKAKYIHDNKYDYSLVDYINNKKIINIICLVHGTFTQTPNDHLSGKGCMDCSGKKRLSTEDFIIKANIIHNNKYNYSLVNYINGKTEIEIVCSYHGSFFQTPTSHLSGRNCSKCSYNCISKMETDWLDSLNIAQKCRQKSICIGNQKFRIDAYVPETNTIYEFYGDFWHGNPLKYDRNEINAISKKTFGELYDKTINRENIYKDNNYNIVSVWENDFKRITKNAS